MKGQYRPVITDRDITLITLALDTAINVALESATKNAQPDEALSALEFRKEAADLIDRLSALQNRAIVRSNTAPVKGQVTLDEELSKVDEFMKGLDVEPLGDEPDPVTYIYPSA